MARTDIAIFVATSGHSGVDRIIQNLIPAFASRGLRVDLLHVKKHGPNLDRVPANVRVVELGSAHTYTSLVPLMRYLRQARPKALLSDKDRVNRVALLATRLAGSTTCVVVRTGTTVSRDLEERSPLDRWITYLSMHYLYRWAHGIIVPSQGAADDLARFARVPTRRIRVVPSPIVTPALHRRAEAQLDHPWLTKKTDPVILGAGELCARKDFETLIRAFARVREQQPCKLIILGKGRRHAALKQLSDDLGIGANVSLPGFVDNPFAYMKAADLFVLSSTYEGFGNVLVESLAVGTPVVATDCPSGPREILRGGRYGRLVPVGDVLALAAAIGDTLDNPPNRAYLQEAAESYTVATSAGRYLEALGFCG